MAITREDINTLLDNVPVEKYPDVFNLLQPFVPQAPAEVPSTGDEGEIKFEFPAQDTL